MSYASPCVLCLVPCARERVAMHIRANQQTQFASPYKQIRRISSFAVSRWQEVRTS